MSRSKVEGGDAGLVMILEEEDDELPAPLVVYVSEDRTGATFSLELRTRRSLQAQFRAHPSPRIFIGHDTRADFEQIYGSVLRQILIILTGVTEDRLHELGPVEFREAVTERVLKGLTA